MKIKGCYPVHRNVFEIETTPAVGEGLAVWSKIAQMESFGVAINNGVEEWNPMENEGWLERMITAKDIVISLSGKRCVGDVGNDFVANSALESPVGQTVRFRWTMPGGTVLTMRAILVVSTFGGDSTAVDALELEVQSSGKPEITTAAEASAKAKTAKATK